MINLYEYLTKEYNAHFLGWDFSYVKNRIIEDKLPWNYEEIVEKIFIDKNCLLDMHTGGGELLVSLKNLPVKVYATEGYEPNIPIADKRLKEKNIILKPLVNVDKIPFDNDFFDIIINRHGSFNINELKRTLQKDGLFITQQVGGLNSIELNMAFETKTMDYVEWCLVKNIDMFRKSGMEIIEYSEYIGKMKFMDIGSVVYYLKCIPWQVNDFSIDQYYEKLEILYEIMKKDGFINITMHRFYIIVKNI